MTKMKVVIHNEKNAKGAMLYKVRVGPLADEAQVQALQQQVAAARLGSPYKVRL